MLPDNELYSQRYTEMDSRFCFFRPSNLGADCSPIIAELFRPGENYSPMEPMTHRGSYCLIDANPAALEANIAEAFGHPTYDAAVATGGKIAYICRGFCRNDDAVENEGIGSRTKFVMISQNGECQNQFENVSMGAMTNVRAFAPRIINDETGNDNLGCWKTVRLHEIRLSNDYPGFFGMPDTCENANGLQNGFVTQYLRHYPAYKHAAGQKNGRSIPHVVENVDGGDIGWRSNVSDDIALWLSQNYQEIDLTAPSFGQTFWDYVLAITSASRVQNTILGTIGYELKVPFPRTKELFQNISGLGRQMRILEEPEALAEGDENFDLQHAVRGLIQCELVNEDGDAFENTNIFRIQDMKIPAQYKSKNVTSEEMLSQWDEERLQELATISDIEVDELSQILGTPQRIRVTTQETEESQWISNVPENVINFTLGNRAVLQSWMCYYSDLVHPADQPISFQHTTWTPEFADVALERIRLIIHNITILMILRRNIDQLADQVFDDILTWPPNQENE